MPIIRILDLGFLVIIVFILVVSFNAVYALVASENNGNSNSTDLATLALQIIQQFCLLL
jgi:hypothetical protein